ncbi:hypothetical protein [Opitutus terrae]|uniref:Uncharacterized protein n=1 Tax=Opitutus terrae (strain DSM 11246 / JCM 15787 / PB90-1) TaxID=452637 RepID=B1ZUD0_OPITP|nr:hypothetical protein [Opitutus terrae]ACB73973.1 hypothetical protein Oter_0684 [Opitutus terrae PB90-1]
MSFLRFIATLGFAGVCAAAHAEENTWPVRVDQTDDEGVVLSSQWIGPLVFEKPSAEPGRVAGVRPLFARWTTPAGDLRETNVLYPVFTYRTDGTNFRWSVFQLMNRSSSHDLASSEPATTRHDTFDVWPFWFSRDTGSPETSYRALFPIAGTLKSRLGYDELSWTLFPLYGRAEKSGAVSTSTPWPFIKVTRGTEQGFALWPLFGRRERPGEFERQYFLWPLIWNNTLRPAGDAVHPAAPRREVGFLPFYTSETDTGFVNRSYVWPFFGYTDRTQPIRYHETRYFWPFLVQGHGDERKVNRWGPVYTHSIVKGTEKTWIAWPIYREKTWSDPALQHTQRQVLYFLYRSTQQRSATNPQAPMAEKAHLWPLISSWDNGAGRKQVQIPSPLEVFFPDNERVRVSWSPLFALYRFDQTAPDTQRHEFLWGLLTWRRAPQQREFHLGPLFSVRERAGEKRIAFGNGLLAWQRSAATGRWRFFWFDFPAKENKLRAAAR